MYFVKCIVQNVVGCPTLYFWLRVIISQFNSALQTFAELIFVMPRGKFYERHITGFALTCVCLDYANLDLGIYLGFCSQLASLRP